MPRSLRSLDRVARAVPYVLLALLALRLVQAVFAHSLWLDEWATLEGAFAPTSWLERLYTLSGPASVNFPTFYLASRTLGGALAYAGQPVEAIVRLPATILTVVALGLAVRWSVGRPRAGAPAEGASVAGAWLGAALVGILLTAGDWTEHAGEGRAYGPMAALAAAMIVAAARGRVGAACACGLGVVLLHPFGTLVGFAPSLAVLAAARFGLGDSMGLDRRTVRRVAWGAGVVFVLAALWVQMKYIGHQTGGYGLRKRGGDMAAVLAGLDVGAVLLFAGVTVSGGAALLVLRRRGALRAAPPHAPFAALTFAALCGTLGLGAAALAIARPGVNVAMPRYVAWVVPALVVGAAAGAALLVDALAAGRARRAGRAALALAGALLAGGWSVAQLRTAPLGPTWADGLREAARWVEHATGPESAVATDFREIFQLHPPFDEGYPCARAPQIVPYFSPGVRARMACQDGAGRVAFGPEVREVLFVREPIPVTDGRTVVLDGFERAAELRFGNAAVERWVRVE
ncbi:MAG TPA: hypothetical protein VEB43_00290 [Anaeromyxobacter sp.]|nr:hypothetical protein [Anaeromyxobacter sp.]